MGTIYRRRRLVSRLERVLARLLLHQSRPGLVEPRLDLVHTEDVEFKQA